MVDSEKNLVVRLAFEHGDTKSQIAAIKNEIKLLDRGFKAAALEAGGFSDSLNESAARGRTLQQQIALQEQAVKKYGTEAQRLRDRLKSATEAQDAQGRKLAEAKQRHDTLSKAIAAQEKAIKQAEAAGKTGTQGYARMQERLSELKDELAENDAAIKQWEKGLQNADQRVANADKALQKLTIQEKEAKIALGEMKNALAKANNEMEQQSSKAEKNRARLTALSQKQREYADSLEETAQKQERVGRTLTAGSAAIVGAGIAAAGAAIAWEDAFAGVRKTVSGSEEQLAGIETQLLEMSKVKPVESGVFADIAANAGQLGIATEKVVDFTDVMTDLAATTNLSADMGASQFAKFANITQMSQEDFRNLGSTVVELGNNLATTEADIMNMAMRLGAAGSQIGMSQAEILGISGALSSLGLEAEAGGTAFSKLFINLKVAAETGSETLEDYANVAQMSVEEFSALIKNDAAAAITSFIGGLSSGSQSAIVMLDELGISEVRFRDALLRTSNASELFSTSIAMGNRAWKENNALTNEAAVRYGTTASKLTIAGNKAKTAAIAFGKNLMPVVSDGLDFVSGLLDKFNALDESQRKQILTWGAYAAAVGPAIGLIGKANSGIAGAAKALSNLTGVAANAGGGLAGFGAVVKSLLGPAGIAVLAAGLGYGAIEFAKWASGAAEAERATQSMLDTAKQMQETQAVTIFDTGNSDPLGRFGLSAEQFESISAKSRGWLAELIEVWTDGAKESDEILNHFTETFVGGSDEVRSAIEGREALLADYELLDDGTEKKLYADMAQLDAWDKEIAALLKKRQNGFLTEKEKARLNEIIELRAEMKVSYAGAETDGFSSVVSGMQAEIDRATAAGTKADVTLYGDALNALAAGRSSYMDAINESYDAQHKQIMGIEDEAKRTEALAALNERYNQQRLEGEQKYREAALEAGVAAFEGTDMGEQVDALQQLGVLISQYSAIEGGDKNVLSQMEEWTSALDEGKLASLMALIAQLRATGYSDADLTEKLGISPEAIEGLYAQLAEFAKNNPVELSGLNLIFNEAAPDEIIRVLADLDLTEAQAKWELFKTDTSALTTSVGATLTGVTGDGQTFTVTNATINADGTLTGVDGNGNTFTATNCTVNADGTISGVTGNGQTFIVTDVTASAVGTLSGVTGDGQTFTVTNATINADGTLTGVDGNGNTFTATNCTINADGTLTGVDGNGQSFTVSDVTVSVEGTLTGVTGSGQTFTVTNATINADGTLTGVDGNGNTFTATNCIVNADGTLTGVDGNGETFTATGALVNVLGTLYGVSGAGRTFFVHDATVKASAQVVLSGIDKTALANFRDKNGDIQLDEKINAELGIAFGPNWQAELTKKWEEGKLSLTDWSGMPIDVDPSVPIGEQLSANDIVVGTDEDGVLHIICVPELGTPEGDEATEALLASTPLDDTPLEFMGESAGENLERVIAQYAEYLRLQREIDALRASGEVYNDAGFSFSELENQRNSWMSMLKESLYDLSETDIEALTARLAQLMAVFDGGEVNAAQITEMEGLLSFLQAAMEYGSGNANDTGKGIAQNIAAGLLAYGWKGDAQALVEGMQSAVSEAAENYVPNAPKTREAGFGSAELGTAGSARAGRNPNGAATAKKAPGTPPTSGAKEMPIPIDVPKDVPKPEAPRLSEDPELVRAREIAQEAVAIRKQIAELTDGGDAMGAYYAQTAQETTLANLATTLSLLSDEDIEGIGARIGELMAAFDAGEIDDAGLTELQGLLEMLSAANMNYTGRDISAGIAEGMVGYGWTDDANTLEANLQTALNTAFDRHSPAAKMKPTGNDIAAGIGAGMKDYSFAIEAGVLSGELRRSLAGLAGDGRTIGINFGLGLQAGLDVALRDAVRKAQRYAEQITAAFRGAWQIHSPSKVAEDLTKMFGAGLSEGMEDWPRVSEKLLNDDLAILRAGVQSSGDNITNAQTYNQQRTVQLNVSRMQVRDETDIEQIAAEVTRLMKQRQLGRGKW